MFLGRPMSAIKASAKSDETMWSEQQKAIFATVRETTENLAIEARAGTGKTTTAVELIKRMRRSTWRSKKRCSRSSWG